MTARDFALVFDCPRWPACGCSDGTIADDCPGVSRPIGKPETAAAPPAAANSATGGLSPVASSPAGASSSSAGDFLKAFDADKIEQCRMILVALTIDASVRSEDYPAEITLRQSEWKNRVNALCDLALRALERQP